MQWAPQKFLQAKTFLSPDHPTPPPPPPPAPTISFLMVRPLTPSIHDCSTMLEKKLFSSLIQDMLNLIHLNSA